MANNRISLVCTVCQGRQLLGKYYPSTGWAGRESESTVQAFIDEHGQSCDPVSTQWGTHLFALDYEHEDE